VLALVPLDAHERVGQRRLREQAGGRIDGPVGRQLDVRRGALAVAVVVALAPRAEHVRAEVAADRDALARGREAAQLERAVRPREVGEHVVRAGLDADRLVPRRELLRQLDVARLGQRERSDLDLERHGAG
jgi:hypothetical protein